MIPTPHARKLLPHLDDRDRQDDRRGEENQIGGDRAPDTDDAHQARRRDWDAVVAFVSDPSLPPTNNDAERALRHAVIARRISFGTRTDEGSRYLALGLAD